MILRFIAFCSDKIDYLKSIDKLEKDQSERFDLLSFISYTHYPTFIFPAPFIPFKSFVLCVR